MIPAPLKNTACLFLAEENHAKSGTRYLAVVAPEQLVSLAESFLAAGFHLEDVSGLVVSEGAVSVYHFDNFDAPCRCTVLAVAPLDGGARFPSIAAVYQGAEWHERETRDFYGFTYENNPNFVPLLLPEDMADVHPLMKDASDRAPLAAIFSAPERGRTIVNKVDGFTLLDLPEPEKAPEPEEPAVAEKQAEAKKPAAPEETPVPTEKTATAEKPVVTEKPAAKAAVAAKPVATEKQAEAKEPAAPEEAPVPEKPVAAKKAAVKEPEAKKPAAPAKPKPKAAAKAQSGGKKATQSGKAASGKKKASPGKSSAKSSAKAVKAGSGKKGASDA